MVVSVALEPQPDAPVNYTALGETLTAAVEAQLPPSEQNDTAITVTLDESAVGTFSYDTASGNLTQLTQTVTDEVCAGTITCNVSPPTIVDSGDARRRLQTGTIEQRSERTFAPEAGVTPIGTALAESAGKSEGVSDPDLKSSAITANAAVETQVAPRPAMPLLVCAWAPRPAIRALMITHPLAGGYGRLKRRHCADRPRRRRKHHHRHGDSARRRHGHSRSGDPRAAAAAPAAAHAAALAAASATLAAVRL